jgi:hypothetical protein
MKAKKVSHDSTKLNALPEKGEKTDCVYLTGSIGVTLEGLNVLREAMFEEVRKFPIPQNLVDAVRNFQPHAPVTWLNDIGTAAATGDALVEPVVEELPSKSPDAITQLVSYAKSKIPKLKSPPKTAGDALAKCLRYQLALADGEVAPVRVKKRLAPSVIAGVAIDILQNCALFNQPPGEELIDLFRALLKLDTRRLKSSREFAAQYEAAWIIAQRPSVSTRQLARILEVDPSSVSRWRKDARFRKLLESRKEFIQDLNARGFWPPKS